MGRQTIIFAGWATFGLDPVSFDQALCLQSLEQRINRPFGQNKAVEALKRLNHGKGIGVALANQAQNTKFK